MSPTILDDAPTDEVADVREPAEQSQAVAEPLRPNEADITLLQDRIPQEYMLSRATALLTAAIGAVYLWLSYFRPLWHTDLWQHLNYGRVIWRHGGIPATEPTMPLAVGVPFIDTAWLSQLIGYGTVVQFGTPGLKFLYAGSITLAAACLVVAVYRKSRHVTWSLVAVGLFLLVDHQQLLIIRPQLPGVVMFVGLLALLTGRWRRIYWGVVPLMFVLWANLHGSFVCGLGLIGCFLVGRIVDVSRRVISRASHDSAMSMTFGDIARLVRTIAAETQVRRYFILLELAAVAVLVNPYGLGLYAEVFNISSNPNLANLIEWDPLTLRMKQGRAAAIMTLLLIFAYRMTPRRISATEVLLLVGLGVSAMWTSRMILWWAPIAAYYFAIHGAATWRASFGLRLEPSPKRGLWSIVTVGLIWIAFAYAPFGHRLIHGAPTDAKQAERSFRRNVGPGTPIDVTRYLRRNPPRGLVFNSSEWGDYMLWAGPQDLQLFATTHVHLIPPTVWRDYMSIAHAGSNWEDRLDMYGVNTVIVDKPRREGLIKQLRADKQAWSVDYEDRQAVVFVRNEPIESGATR